ncbi:MAG: biotin--[acetyl-CoA-carboxylase] ligase [Bacteroidales bacterium]|jgi:BirA family biotin operon repressor/biotin-[acetyl-CoA-carboxylase] ligase|nr:biotin--[acetyl-CoA-carboxylase] ligase [Bacteroidales bacterium]
MEILKFDSLDSTNNYAKTLIKEGKAKNAQAIYAVSQTAGRGQASNAWESETGKNLTFSLILQPENIEPRNQFLISQAVSIGIVNYLKFLINNEPIHIKWSNDIYVGMKKIAGILIENTIQNNRILYSVVGIGLNVNQTEFTKNAGNPTSLSLINKAQYDLETELNELANHILHTLECLQFDDGLDCKIRYLEHLLFLNEEREYLIRNEKIVGKIIGINGFGFLQIQAKNGTIFECDLKEIVYIL